MIGQKQIIAYFEAHRNEMLRDIGTLIRIPSEKGEPAPGMPFGRFPAEALAAAGRIAQGMGFPVRGYGGFAVAVDLNGLPRQLDILAHLDVVPGGGGWSVTRPFEPAVRDGRLYGRGAADDKGPAVAALYALRAARDLHFPLKKSVRLVLGSDEESGSADLKHYYEREREAPMTFSPDAEFPVVNIEKGRYSTWFRASWKESARLPRILSVRGGVRGNMVPDTAEAVAEGLSVPDLSGLLKAAEARTGIRFSAGAEDGKIVLKALGTCAHASTPGEGNNAVTGLIDLLAGLPFADSEGFRRLRAVRRLFPHGDWRGKAAGVAMKDDVSGELTMSLNLFEYGPSGLKGYFDGRTPVCAGDGNLKNVFCAKAESLGLTPDGTGVSPAHHVPEDTPFVRTLLKCYEQYSGRKGRCLAVGGGTYVHRLKNGVAFGCAMPGTDNRMHGADEYAVIGELLTGAEIFTQAILDLCS